MKCLLDFRNIRSTTQWPMFIYWTEQEQLLNRYRHYEKLDMLITDDLESLHKFLTVFTHFLLSCLPGARPLYMLLNRWCSWRLPWIWFELVTIACEHSPSLFYCKLQVKTHLGQFLKRNNLHFARLGCSWGFAALLSSFTTWLKDISSVLGRKRFLPLYSSADT